MNKKVICSLAACICITMASFGQVGVQVGFNQSIERNKIGSESKFDTQVALNGFKVGVFYDHTFKYGLGLYYGVNYSLLHNQSKWKGEGNGWFERTQSTMHNLDIPLHFQYKLTIANDTYLMAYVGPTFALGLAGTEIISTKNGLPENNPLFQLKSTQYDLYKKDSNLDGFADTQRFDLLLSVGVGLQYKNIQLKGGYDFGMLNRYGNAYMDGSRWFDRRNEWSIKVAYLFGKWKW